MPAACEVHDATGDRCDRARHAVCMTRVTAAATRVQYVGFVVELAAAERGQAVELRAAVVVRRAPLGLQQAAHFEPVQRRIQRALLDLQHVARRLLDELRDRVAVHRAAADRLQDQHVERARQERRFVFGVSHKLFRGHIVL